MHNINRMLNKYVFAILLLKAKLSDYLLEKVKDYLLIKIALKLQQHLQQQRKNFLIVFYNLSHPSRNCPAWNNARISQERR